MKKDDYQLPHMGIQSVLFSSKYYNLALLQYFLPYAQESFMDGNVYFVTFILKVLVSFQII